MNHSPARERNRRGDGGRLKEELIEAAMRLLDRSPDGPLSLRSVAKEAGVAAPSVYRHYENAQALMSDIVRACWQQMGAAMAEAARAPGRDPIARLQRQMAAFVAYAMERPSRYQSLFAMRPIAPEADAREGYLRPAYRQVIATLEDHVEVGGGLPACDMMSSALLVLSLAHGRIALAHLAPDRAGNAAASVSRFVSEQIARILGATA